MRSVILFLACLFISAATASGQSTADLEATICQGDTALMSVSVTDADSLQWYYNSVAVPGGNNDTLTAFRSGIYYLKAFRSQCFDVSGDIRIFMAYPRANDDYVKVPLGALATFDVLANDNPNCAPFDPKTFTIISPPVIGTLVSAAGGMIVYKPPVSSFGTDKFVYRITDVEGRRTNEATVSVELYIDCAMVYPNPVEDKLNITVNNKRIHAIKIFDALGRELYHTPVSSTMVSIDMHAFAQGFYVVRLLEHDGPGCMIKVQKR